MRRSVFKGAVNPPKTKAGNRTICLTGMAVAALEEHRGAATREGGDPQWVFPSRAGTPLSVHNVHNRSWKPLLGRAGLPLSTRMHDLRHTCATLLLREGVPVKMVSEMLGHGDVAITLAVYQSVLLEVQRRSGRLPGLVGRLHPLAWIDFAPVQDHRRFQVRSHGPKLQVPEDKVRVDVFGERLLLSVLADVQHDTQEHRLVAPIPSGEGVIPAPSRLPVPALNPLGDVRLG